MCARGWPLLAAALLGVAVSSAIGQTLDDPDAAAAHLVQPVLFDADSRTYVQHYQSVLNGSLTVIRHRATLKEDVIFLDGAADVVNATCSATPDAAGRSSTWTAIELMVRINVT